MVSLRKFFLELKLPLWLMVSLSTAEALAQIGWQAQGVDSDSSLRGLSVVGQVVWASGSGGTFVKTTDRGTTWRVSHVAGAEKLDFRDVEAFSAQVAYLLSRSSVALQAISGGTVRWQSVLPARISRAMGD